jgi:hypothetical protein
MDMDAQLGLEVLGVFGIGQDRLDVLGFGAADADDLAAGGGVLEEEDLAGGSGQGDEVHVVLVSVGLEVPRGITIGVAGQLGAFGKVTEVEVGNGILG